KNRTCLQAIYLWSITESDQDILQKLIKIMVLIKHFLYQFYELVFGIKEFGKHKNSNNLLKEIFAFCFLFLNVLDYKKLLLLDDKQYVLYYVYNLCKYMLFCSLFYYLY